jgi:hypothetical protein
VEEVTKYCLDDGKGRVDPEVLSSQVSVENAVHLRAVGMELCVVADHVGTAVEGEPVAFEPPFLEVAVQPVEDV